jgi:hypothetical protein
MSRPTSHPGDHPDGEHPDGEHVDELHRLLGTIEDWLLHCGDDTRDDLGRFLTGLGWPGTPQRAAAALVCELGDLAVLARRATSFTTNPRPT